MPDINLAQAIGILASMAIIFAFGMKLDHRLKILVATGNFLFVIHFLLLGAHTGAIVCLINIFRALLSIRFHNSTRLMLCFIGAYVFMASITYDGLISILPYVSGVVGSFALFKLSGIPMRLCVFIGSFSWMAYDIYFMSLGGIITECFVISVNCITIYRLLKENKANETSH